MTREPDFEELVGPEVAGGERERLRHAHGLLVQAGPPPELPPELAAGPTLGMTLSRRRARRRHRQRLALLAAAVVAVLVVFLGGYIVGNRSGSGTPSTVHVLRLRGTAAAPDAFASLRLRHRDEAGNWPMVLSVTGLPPLPKSDWYEVYLVRDGEPFLPCGAFAVKSTNTGVTVSLNAPYEFHQGDTWIITKHVPGSDEPGKTVLRPVT